MGEEKLSLQSILQPLQPDFHRKEPMIRNIDWLIGSPLKHSLHPVWSVNLNHEPNLTIWQGKVDNLFHRSAKKWFQAIFTRSW